MPSQERGRSCVAGWWNDFTLVTCMSQHSTLQTKQFQRSKH
jgi:hypothetical protein